MCAKYLYQNPDMLPFKAVQARQARDSRRARVHQRALLKLLRSPALHAAVGSPLQGAPARRVRARRLGHTTLMARRPWVRIAYMHTEIGKVVWLLIAVTHGCSKSLGRWPASYCTTMTNKYWRARFGDPGLLGQDPALRMVARGLLQAATFTSTRRRMASGSS